jgi:hypothetical protein
MAFGRKNSLFCGDVVDGRTWSHRSTNPEIWLTDALERVVSGRTKKNQLHELLARDWKAAREAEAEKAAARRKGSSPMMKSIRFCAKTAEAIMSTPAPSTVSLRRCWPVRPRSSLKVWLPEIFAGRPPSCRGNRESSVS